MMAGRGYIVGWYTCVYIKVLYVKCFEPAIPWDPVSRWSIKEDFDVVSNSSIKRCYLPSLYTSKKICVKKKTPLEAILTTQCSSNFPSNKKQVEDQTITSLHKFLPLLPALVFLWWVWSAWVQYYINTHRCDVL